MPGLRTGPELMSGEFLTPEDLEELTGLSQGAAQIKWLRREGVKVFVRADGKPRVLWSDLRARKEPRQRDPAQPNFSALPSLR